METKEKTPSITKYQRGLMEHTISGPDRNWFGTGKGTDATEFDKLVEMGLATKQKAPCWTGDEFIYSLTKEGKEAV